MKRGKQLDQEKTGGKIQTCVDKLKPGKQNQESPNGLFPGLALSVWNLETITSLRQRPL